MVETDAMAFCTVPGLAGRVFIPSHGATGERKHRCPDCFACQHCSQDRCRVCLGTGRSGRCSAPETPPQENDC